VNRSRLRRAEQILAVTIVAVGLAGLVVSRDVDSTAPKGAFLLDVPGDYIWGRQLAFNPLGALLMLGMGVLALGAVSTGRRPVVLSAAGAAVALAVVTTFDLTQSNPALGSRAGNVALLLALGVGLAAIELSSPPSRASA
jgi:hypothetical protein